MAFALVGVEQSGRSVSPHGRGELPAEVDRVAEAEVQPLAAERRVHMRGIAREQHPAAPVGLGLPGVVGPAGRTAAQALERHIDAGDIAYDRLEFVERDGGVAVLRPRAEASDENAPGDRAVGVDAAGCPRPAAAQLAGVGEVGHRLVPHQLRIGAGEADAQLPADRAAAAVGSDDPPGRQLARAGLHHDIGVVGEVRFRVSRATHSTHTHTTHTVHLDTSAHLHTEPGAVLPEQRLEIVLGHKDAARDRGVRGQRRIALIDQLIAEQHAREMPGDREAARAPRAPVQLVDEGVLPAVAGEGTDGRQQPPLYVLRGRQQPAPVEDLRAGDIDRPGLDRRIGLREPLQDPHPYALECQFTGEEEARGPGSDDDHIAAPHDTLLLVFTR
ncbi:hypothetical protein SVIO_022370 [Streptomyces violaceusniger]|uniref:Uncharacterized protein n=1 Tax=Streptomyces violaceusniger TaxID=68280 RepID=A0A4D4KTW1_STRVO|nr:hypothetical protein SVIO_022370 [Streptomyces violaceusniger]